MCPTGKVTFPTRKDARRFASKRKWRKLRTYRCLECDLWHNTTFTAQETAWARTHRG